MMQGLDWSALPAVAAYLGAQDIEMLIRGLLHLRDYNDKLNEAARGV
jgi:hypothetical protein